MSEGQRCLYIVVLLIHTTIGTGEGPTSPPSPRSSTFRIEDNELTGTFPPFEDIFGQVPEKQFATENNTVVTSQIGSTALIPCVIRNIGDGIISWIRRKDYHLLTVGLTTYSSDQRFQAIHLQHSEDWTLKVKFVQKRDAGVYECQVSSHPPTSIFLRLDVVEARAQISGPTEKYLKPGSTLRLQCSVVQTTEAPAFVFWYHNNRMINYDAERGVNVTTDPEQRLSDLLIPVAGINHAGNYTCVPNNAVPASIYVHIFNGENPAAMQSSSPKYLQLSSVTYIYTLTATYLIIR
ncbi:Down syndrome cell adhesion molecule-like protein 1 homolog [Aricia agestis]|uniref:Down syndrome cell adhesion molecule-like protein 1 homolog n=1 Tax=Aricia agestis TaxID=91739 RepID=UPI001C2050E8|nr:Down syndrome cell adhesion molecule-like protein 1 homolog [Aricia agestis]